MAEGFEGTARRRLPRAVDMADAIRAGSSTEVIAVTHEVGEGWVREQLRRAGFDPDTGLPGDPTPAKPATPARPPSVGPRIRDLASRAWTADLAEQAACLDAHPDQFYSEDMRQIALSIEICRGCAVRVECLERALSLPRLEQFGVWGGTSAATRQQLLRSPRGRAS